MSETWFSDNFADLSKPTGVQAGFQFEFYCERCRNAYRTEFEPYRGGQAAGWLDKASGMLGGILGNAGSAVEGVATQNYGKVRDEKFREAVEQAKVHFHRCAQCMQYVCGQCFHEKSGLCYNCAPDAEVAAQAARAQGHVDAAKEKAYDVGKGLAKDQDVTTEKQMVCPNCRAETHGAKFCPECGTKMAVAAFCYACGAELPPGAKFCVDCGTKMPD